MALRSPRGTDYLHKKNKGRLYEPALVLWEAQVTKLYRPIVPSQLAEELNKAFDSVEPHTICREIGRALYDFNVSEIAKETGLQRTSIYRAFSSNRLPNFATVLAVLAAMGLQLKVAPKRGAMRRTPAPRNSRA